MASDAAKAVSDKHFAYSSIERNQPTMEDEDRKPSPVASGLPDDESSDDESSDDGDGELEQLYLETGDIGDWIDADTSKELLTRWQVESEFVKQLKQDPILRQVLYVVVNHEEHEEDDPVFESALKTIYRAFSNRFDMVCALARQSKQTTGAKEEQLNAVEKEIKNLCSMTHIFKNESGSFGVFEEKLVSELIEFVNWRKGLDVSDQVSKHAVAGSSSAVDHTEKITFTSPAAALAISATAHAAAPIKGDPPQTLALANAAAKSTTAVKPAAAVSASEHAPSSSHKAEEKSLDVGQTTKTPKQPVPPTHVTASGPPPPELGITVPQGPEHKKQKKSDSSGDESDESVGNQMQE